MRHPVDCGPAEGSGARLPAAAAAQVVQETGACVGLVYLLPRGERVLRLAMISGVPRQIAAPWARYTVTSPVPVADAVRERRLVWLGSQEEAAYRYPRAALLLSCPFAMAAAPITTGTVVWGGLVLLWPGSRPVRLSEYEHDAIVSGCHRLGLLLQQAANGGHPVVPGSEPHVLSQPAPRTPAPAGALAAVDFAERLPEGCCALDRDSRITFATARAADLLKTDIPHLLGSLPWKALPWLDEALFEDRHRAAVISRRPASFTVLRPPDQWLSFHLHADARGISVRITPAADEAQETRHTAPAIPVRAPAPALHHLMRLAATLTEAVGVQDVVDQAADEIMPAFDAQGLIMFMAQDDRLRVVGHCGYSTEVVDHFDGARLSDPPTPAARALADGVTSFFASPDEMEQMYPGIPALTKKEAWAFLPLIASGHPIGCLVLSYDRPHSFDPQERAVLISTAGLIAQALDRARLYDAKHRLAQGLQAGLLPHALPNVPDLEAAARYLPAERGMDIGGDFYDLIPLDPTAAAAAIGDVQGHNITAAALMGQVRTAIHATAGAPPGDVLARANRLLTDLNPGLFTSCLYAHLDLVHHRGHLATAGHLPPILRHPDGRAEVLDLPTGLLLGIDPAATYPTTEIPLPPGALLALYTDGLVETPGADLEDAINDLAGQLTQAEHHSIDALADSLVHYAGQRAPRSDDIALLLISPNRTSG
ncbi:PAS sensor protein [Streptomyces dysideae]|uniref:protein-serine/threonine phosphatase n=1 Tax=Streptomyces dysideae TaxID=909626 RepID=A0A101UQM9_9ACTN|nr:SpoIIE family protein phosphatase [Streptomyces dysideae]KUO15027.1 PAS sensor protein [Streptomyces dysideae]